MMGQKIQKTRDKNWARKYRKLRTKTGPENTEN
jgi:hypothetical protein